MPNRDFAAATSVIEGAPKTGTGHRDVLVSVLSAISTNAIESVADHFTEDAELHIHGFAPIDGSWRGRNNVIAAAHGNFQKLSDQTPRIEAMIEQGDDIALFLHETGRLEATGQTYEIRGVIRCTFKGPQLCRIEEFMHTSQPV